MIGGLLGQDMQVTEAAVLGVFLHSRAGAIAAQRVGHHSMTATDIIKMIGPAFQELRTAPTRDENELGIQNLV